MTVVQTRSEVDHFAEFCATHLIQSEDRWEGTPLELEAWQRRMMGEALEFDEDGWPSWRSVVIVAPRKNGKTAILAALSLYRLLTSDGRPEILLAAPSDKVAGRLFDACARFVRRSPELSKLLRVRDHAGEIVREDGMGIIYRLSSDPQRLYGYNPTHVVCDELASWTTPNLRRAYAALTSGGGARSAPQVFTITTAAEAQYRHDSILGSILDAALDAENVVREPGLTVCRMVDARTLVWEYAAPTADPRDTVAMKLANPASWITEDFLKRQAENPELTDAQVLQLHGCVWAASSSTWIAPDAWAAQAVERTIPLGAKIVIGFDGSAKRDSTALVAATTDGFVCPIRVWEKPEGAADWQVPRDEVSDVLDRMISGYQVLEVACDPFGWASEIQEWERKYGEIIVTFPTSTRERMAVACDRFRADTLAGTLTHDGDPVLTRHVGHAVAKVTPFGTVVTKSHPDSPRKIDVAIAAVIAHERAQWLVQNPKKQVLLAVAYS